MLNKIETKTELANFLSVPVSFFQKFDVQAYYHVFFIPKPHSEEKRMIEEPVGELRPVLDLVSNELEELYSADKTDAAYGFIRSRANDPDKRNIKTNAMKHLKMKYLLNIDLDNFFYQVNEQKVFEIFNNHRYFHFNDEVKEIITHLVTFNGRLPMGSPTSPPLSNLAAINLDNDLMNWAVSNHFNYTRYVDDLSFSSNMLISKTHLNEITELIHANGFLVEPRKTRFFDKDESKEITGLIVTDKISIPEDFFEEFNESIKKLAEIVDLAHQYPDNHVFEWLNKLRQSLNGRLAFIAMIYNKYHPLYSSYKNKIDAAFKSTNTNQSMSWRYAGYMY